MFSSPLPSKKKLDFQQKESMGHHSFLPAAYASFYQYPYKEEEET